MPDLCDTFKKLSVPTKYDHIRFHLSVEQSFYMTVEGSFDPPASGVSREVANLNEKKIHIHLFMVSKNLSGCFDNKF